LHGVRVSTVSKKKMTTTQNVVAPRFGVDELKANGINVMLEERV
jgi:hypothetical protein